MNLLVKKNFDNYQDARYVRGKTAFSMLVAFGLGQ
jgi:hypothetical protein